MGRTGKVTAKQEGSNGRIVLRKDGEYAGSVATKGKTVPATKPPTPSASSVEKPTSRVKKPAGGRKRRKLTPAQLEKLQEKQKKLHDTLAEKVESIQTSEEWKQYLDFAKSFHKYSAMNAMLIWAQKPNATMVAGFNQWKEKGRVVKKGEKGISIRGFAKKKVVKENKETGEEEEKTFGYFPIVTVFDISQTEPLPGHEGDVTENPAGPKLLTGADSKGTVSKVRSVLEEQGWTVKYEPISGGANGYTDPDAKTVVISSEVDPAQQAKTSLHEWAHIQLGHVDDLEEYHKHRGRQEVEAESVAYVMSGLMGEDSSSYSVGYVAGWSRGDGEVVKETAETVMTAVTAMCTKLEIS